MGIVSRFILLENPRSFFVCNTKKNYTNSPEKIANLRAFYFVENYCSDTQTCLLVQI
jgi:hypothetical protein